MRERCQRPSDGPGVHHELGGVSGVDMFRAIGLMPADEGDVVGNTEPKIDITNDVAHKSTARIRKEVGKCSEGAVVLEECGCNSFCGVITDGIRKWALCVMLHNEKEANVAIFISGSNRDVINANCSDMM